MSSRSTWSKAKRRQIRHRQKPKLDQGPLHPRRVGADVNLDAADSPLFAARSLQVLQQESDHVVLEGDELEDADRLVDGVVA